jgi:uncharacterized protein (TIGR00255 family)
MLHSMTAYGRGLASRDALRIEVELRAVNSKLFDLRLRYPAALKDREMELRQRLTAGIERGKVEAVISFYGLDDAPDIPVINTSLFKKYVAQLQSLADECDLPQSDLMAAVLRIPQVLTTVDASLPEEEWILTLEAVDDALRQFNQFRIQEGSALAQDLQSRIEVITDLTERITPMEHERINRTRQRIRQNLLDFIENEQVDENRFEQEILFYLEKMDITEEKVRLAQHCTYFVEVLSAPDKDKGRKLNFISQEIGREINTLGAKAYDSGIQQVVVLMKNELEKIKEQLANIL